MSMTHVTDYREEPVIVSHEVKRTVTYELSRVYSTKGKVKREVGRVISRIVLNPARKDTVPWTEVGCEVTWRQQGQKQRT